MTVRSNLERGALPIAGSGPVAGPPAGAARAGTDSADQDTGHVGPRCPAVDHGVVPGDQDTGRPLAADPVPPPPGRPHEHDMAKHRLGRPQGPEAAAFGGADVGRVDVASGVNQFAEGPSASRSPTAAMVHWLASRSDATYPSSDVPACGTLEACGLRQRGSPSRPTMDTGS